MTAAKTTILVVLPMGTSSTTIVTILVVMRTTIVTILVVMRTTIVTMDLILTIRRAKQATLTGNNLASTYSQLTLGLLLAGSEVMLENMYLIWGM